MGSISIWSILLLWKGRVQPKVMILPHFTAFTELHYGPTDTPNLTAFFSEIKTALGSKVVSVGESIVLRL